jgi:ribonuclease T2
MYYMRLPTYEWLAGQGITPSNTTTYTLSDMQDALTAEYGRSKYPELDLSSSDQKSGAIPYIGCSGPRYNTTAAGEGSTDSGRTVVDEGSS